MAQGPHDQTWDAVETYFECITTCSLDDGDCITRCVEQLKDTGSYSGELQEAGLKPSN